jgi:exonuclease III
LKIVTWNCNGALRNKFEQLKEFDADIFVIQECENPKESLNKQYSNWAKNFLWIGDNKNKGIGVFATEDIKLEPLQWISTYKDHPVKYFLPCSINNKFNLLAVWAHQNKSPNFGYIGQLWKYIQTNKKYLTNIIIAGDFNSNSIWDQWDRWWNHSDVTKELRDLGIVSLYHEHLGEEQGKEKSPTFYLQRNIEKPYHIDYVYASAPFIKSSKTFKIGNFNKWITFSDHLPLFFEFQID